MLFNNNANQSLKIFGSGGGCLEGEFSAQLWSNPEVLFFYLDLDNAEPCISLIPYHLWVGGGLISILNYNIVANIF